ncbi:hypothetical protein [Dokdonella sp.]|uniref:hypothetical protein n=1 Tax=Dokdonella sp. TaxID=2291710 RepID=UPI003C44EAFF
MNCIRSSSISVAAAGLLLIASLASAQNHRFSTTQSSVIPPPPVPAGTCASNAEGIISGTGTFNGNNCGSPSAITNYNNALCGSLVDGYPGPEEFWQVNIGDNIASDILLTPASADLGIFLVSACGSGTSCVAFRDSIGGGVPSGLSIGTTAPDTNYGEFPASNAPAGTYYAYIDSYYAAGGSSCSDYSLTVAGTLPVELTNFEVD